MNNSTVRMASAVNCNVTDSNEAAEAMNGGCPPSLMLQLVKIRTVYFWLDSNAGIACGLLSASGLRIGTGPLVNWPGDAVSDCSC